jgi:hypothetical protein
MPIAPSRHGAISGFAEQCRKMNTVRSRVRLASRSTAKKQLIGNIVLLNFSLFGKSGDKEAERSAEPTVNCVVVLERRF